MRRINLISGQRLKEEDLLREGAALPAQIVAAAEDIVRDVRNRGDAALRELTERFDGYCPTSFRVSSEELTRARELVDPAFVESLEYAADNIRIFHECERLEDFYLDRADGVRLGVRITPIATAGVYIPGGRANYPSTVLMNVVPAKVAGVPRVVMVTPPQAGGHINPYTLVAADVAGVDEVYAVGGAQAIAALAFGTESIPKVDKITGPGNAYVAAAKRCVSGVVGLDMIAGPSEVCILADSSADAVVVAADLMAQAEHDPLASCYLVTCDEELVARVEVALDLLLVQSPRVDITRESLDTHGVIVVCEEMEAALAAVDIIAPEHLELHCADADRLLDQIHNAGAIFVGAWSSEPLGDYVAGPNHTLPTGGTARFSSPLGVYDFQKRSSVISYTARGLAHDAPHVQVLAQSERLWAHALSVGLRRELLEHESSSYKNLEEIASGMDRVAWPMQLTEPGTKQSSVPQRAEPKPSKSNEEGDL